MLIIYKTTINGKTTYCAIVSTQLLPILIEHRSVADFARDIVDYYHDQQPMAYQFYDVPSHQFKNMPSSLSDDEKTKFNRAFIERSDYYIKKAHNALLKQQLAHPFSKAPIKTGSVLLVMVGSEERVGNTNDASLCIPTSPRMIQVLSLNAGVENWESAQITNCYELVKSQQFKQASKNLIDALIKKECDFYIKSSNTGGVRCGVWFETAQAYNLFLSENKLGMFSIK